MYQKDVSHIGSTHCIEKNSIINQYKYDFIHLPAFSGIIYMILRGFYNAALKKVYAFKVSSALVVQLSHKLPRFTVAYRQDQVSQAQ